MVMNIEAYGLTRDFVYGKLPTDLTLNDTYFVPGREIAKKQILLGGFRLGLSLWKFFEVRGMPALSPKLPVSRGLCLGNELRLHVVVAAVEIVLFGTTGGGAGARGRDKGLPDWRELLETRI